MPGKRGQNDRRTARGANFFRKNCGRRALGAVRRCGAPLL